MMDDHDYEERHESAWRGLGAMTVAAAVGAGVALLFTTDTGRRTRKAVSRQVRDMELRDRAEMLGTAALEGIEVMRGRQDRRSHAALYAALGTAAGATLAATLAPESARRARAWVEDTIDELRHNASTRWRMHRARRSNRMTPDTAQAIRRLEDSVDLVPDRDYVSPVAVPEAARGDMG
jgi:gas vesicle protein